MSAAAAAGRRLGLRAVLARAPILWTGLGLAAVVLAARAGPGNAAPAAEAGLAAYARTAVLQPEGAGGLQRLTLPLAVLQASEREDLADLRIFGADGRTRPYAWAGPPDAPRTRQVTLPPFAWPAARLDAPRPDERSTEELQVDVARDGRVLRLRSTRSGRTPQSIPSSAPAPAVWLLDASAAAARPASADERPVALQLDWTPSPQGLNLTLQLEGSDDARQWRTLTAGTLLELPSRERGAPAVRDLAWPPGVPLPRYLRLHGDAPLPLTQATLAFEARAQDGGEAVTTQVFQPAPAEGTLPAHWVLDLGGAVAIQQLRLPLTAPNAVVALQLEQRRSADGPWTLVARPTAWHLQRDGQDRAAPPLRIAAPPARWWRLLPDARTPVDTSRPWAVELHWRPPSLVFVADAAPLTLAVGRARASPIALPLAQLMPDWQAGAEHRLPAARLGPLATTPATARATAEGGDERVRKQRWLWAALTGAVLGLGVLAWRLHSDLARTPTAKGGDGAGSGG